MEKSKFEVLENNQVALYFVDDELGGYELEKVVVAYVGDSTKVFEDRISDDTALIKSFTSYECYIEYDKEYLSVDEEEEIHEHVKRVFIEDYIEYERKQIFSNYHKLYLN